MFWIPPGGGVEREESIFDYAKREVMEETGVDIDRDRVIYLRQWVDTELDYHHVELLILVESFVANLPRRQLRNFAFHIVDFRCQISCQRRNARRERLS